MSDVDCGHWADMETEPVHIDHVVTDVPNPPYPPVEVRTIPVHIAYLAGTPVEAWEDASPIDRADHRQTCMGCAWCADGRSYGWCKYEGVETEIQDDGNCACGSPILTATDYSDVKASER